MIFFGNIFNDAFFYSKLFFHTINLIKQSTSSIFSWFVAHIKINSMHGLCGGVSTRWTGPAPTAVKVSCHIELCCCCPSCGCPLAARLLPLFWAAPWRPGYCPSFCCLLRLTAALVLLPLAAGCCLRSAAPGGWLLLWRPAAAPGGWLLSLAARLLPIVGLPSFGCPWRLAAAFVLLLWRLAAPGGWLLPSFFPWRLAAALDLLPLAFQSQTLIQIPASLK